MKRLPLLMLLFVAGGLAQTAPVPAQPKPISVTISLFDKKGHALTDVRKDEVAVEFDGVPARVLAVDAEGDAPFVYAILVDCSGSSRDKAVFMRDYALDIVKLVAKGENVGGLILFSGDGTEVVDITTLDAARRSLTDLRLRGGSPLYDALAFGADALSKLARPGQAKVLFVVSDGEDNASSNSLDTTLSRLKADGIRVFALGLLARDHETSRAKKALQRLAEETGGTVFVTKSPDEGFVASFREALAATVNVTFSTTAVPDGKEHPIQIRTVRKDARVVAPTGYILGR